MLRRIKGLCFERKTRFDGEYINLCFADDVIHVRKHLYEVISMITKFLYVSLNIGLSINIRKTQAGYNEFHKKQQCTTCIMNTMVSQILGVNLRGHMRNKDIRRRIKITHRFDSRAGLKWRWAGHVVKMDNKRWTFRIFKWRPLEYK